MALPELKKQEIDDVSGAVNWNEFNTGLGMVGLGLGIAPTPSAGQVPAPLPDWPILAVASSGMDIGTMASSGASTSIKSPSGLLASVLQAGRSQTMERT